MTDDLIPLSHLVIEGFGASVYGPANIDTLERQLVSRGVEIVHDDIGRRCVSRAVARMLFAERANAKAAAQAAEDQRRAEQAESVSPAERVRRGIAARAERQKAMLAQNPSLDAHALMVMGDVEHGLEAAGRRRDEMLAAERAGYVGHGRFGRIPVEG